MRGYFDLGIYENLSISASPADWDGIAIDPDPLFLPDDGFADWLALGAVIGLGETLGGFSVQFDFLGADPPGPGAQFWEIVDPVTFDPLASGFTALVAVPEPSSITLLAFGLFLIAIYSRRRRPLFKQSRH